MTENLAVEKIYEVNFIKNHYSREYPQLGDSFLLQWRGSSSAVLKILGGRHGRQTASGSPQNLPARSQMFIQQDRSTTVVFKETSENIPHLSS
ncbi:hypothetical protein [Paenibacillus sp. FSL L8-0463]|uniref:hypothetical protein n=1 Tax=Paenibacillus sp. FSL L8-0463 TaxID=2954687 RepID=UPI003119EE7D